MLNVKLQALRIETSSHTLHATKIFSALANDRRLQILTALLRYDELTVNALVDMIGLNQSALSQHLAKLRHVGLVATRRERQWVFYHISSPTAQALLASYIRTEQVEICLCQDVKGVSESLQKLSPIDGGAPAGASLKPQILSKENRMKEMT